MIRVQYAILHHCSCLVPACRRYYKATDLRGYYGAGLTRQLQLMTGRWADAKMHLRHVRGVRSSWWRGVSHSTKSSAIVSRSSSWAITCIVLVACSRRSHKTVFISHFIVHYIYNGTTYSPSQDLHCTLVLSIQSLPHSSSVSLSRSLHRAISRTRRPPFL